MIVDLGAGAIYLQDRGSGWKRPLSLEQRIQCLGLTLLPGGLIPGMGKHKVEAKPLPRVDWGVDRMLFLPPVPHRLTAIRFSLLAGPDHVPVHVVVRGSADSRDGVDGEWVPLGEWDGYAGTTRVSGSAVFFADPPSVRWVRMEVEPGLVAEPVFIQLEGEPEAGPLMFCDRHGAPVSLIDVGVVMEGGTATRSFWVKNVGAADISGVVTIEPANPSMRSRFWLKSGSHQSRRLELGVLRPGKVVGPIHLSVDPKPGDPVDEIRGYVRLGRRVVSDVQALQACDPGPQD